MTLYTSDNMNQKRCLNGLMWSMVAAAFLAVFARVYNHFGHGITSIYMSYVFAIPMLLGGAVYLIMVFLPKRLKIRRISFNVYNAGIATLVSASIIKGICEIAGADSEYIKYFWLTGAILCIAAAAIYIIQIVIRR